jgi:L-threonylcarbamoyladenylate synthase
MSVRLVSLLKRGGIAIVPTDTLYGIVARAFDRKAVRRLYAIRRKTPKKPFIVLISSTKELATFGIRPNAASLRFLSRVWPGKVSVILHCPSKKFAYLHLGTRTLAFRLPKSRRLIELLKKTGPLVAPSANPEGEKPAQTMSQAKKYFARAVDAYQGAGKKMTGTASTVISLLGSVPKVLRQGAIRV